MSRSDRIVVAIVGTAVVMALAGGFLLLSPPSAELDPSAQLLAGSQTTSAAPAPSGAAGTAPIVVDVAGAVAEPGVRELAAGSRVADAIDAAGGFATDADLEAASALNLAQPLVDGQQVRVPRIGEGAGPVAVDPGNGGSTTGSGLINVNTATPEELESLPGIGAVTVQKIVAARQERPFASLQDMVDRGIIHRGQLEDIMDLATVG